MKKHRVPKLLTELPAAMRAAGIYRTGWAPVGTRGVRLAYGADGRDLTVTAVVERRADASSTPVVIAGPGEFVRLTTAEGAELDGWGVEVEPQPFPLEQAKVRLVLTVESGVGLLGGVIRVREVRP